MQSIPYHSLKQQLEQLEARACQQQTEQLAHYSLLPTTPTPLPPALAWNEEQGHYLVIDQYHWLVERALRHSLALLKQQLNQRPEISNEQLCARLSHQIRMILRCSVSNLRGERYPYFYQGLGDRLCFGPCAASIPRFTHWLFVRLDLITQKRDLTSNLNNNVLLTSN